MVVGVMLELWSVACTISARVDGGACLLQSLFFADVGVARSDLGPCCTQ